jgi:transcriptional regulator with XRE-family HTH domain
LGRIIAQHRQEKGLRQRDLGEQLGVSLYRVSVLERGNRGRVPKLEQLVTIAAVLGLSLVYLLGALNPALDERPETGKLVARPRKRKAPPIT